jgi:cytoskeletal protein CcmA (bactofilin family)
MFNKIKFGQPDPASHADQTVIGQSAVVLGNIVSQDLVQLKGRVVGNIDVNGVVNGNIESTGRIELHAGADVKGNISYATVAIEHGAKLYGMMSSKSVDAP